MTGKNDSFPNFTVTQDTNTGIQKSLNTHTQKVEMKLKKRDALNNSILDE